MAKYGVIDVGSNSVRLMVSDGVKTFYKKVITCKLALGMQDGILTKEAVERTVRAVSFFVDYAQKDNCSEVYIFATAAVRNAKNKQYFLNEVNLACGLDVDVVSGIFESEIGAIGALNGLTGGVIDVGGASSEVAFASTTKLEYSHSVNIGAVVVTDKCGQNKNSAMQYINDYIKEYGHVPTGDFFAIGGTATSVSAIIQELEPYDPNLVDGSIVTIKQLEDLVDKLYSLSVEQRMNLKGLQKGRADVIAAGASILLSIMRYLKLSCVTISEKDNLEGYLIKQLEKK